MNKYRIRFRHLSCVYLLFIVVFLIDSFVLSGCLFSPSGSGAAPEVTIVEPLDGDTVNTAEKCIKAEVKSNENIVKVKFFDGNYFIGEVYDKPYTYIWGTACVSTGEHKISAEAIDGSGNSGKSPSILVFVTKDNLYDWDRLDSPVSTDLNSLFTINSSNMWVCGDAGVLLHYYNSNWQVWESPSGISNNLNDLYFLSAGRGFCVGNNIVLEFRDGDWSVVQKTSTKNQLNAVFMVNDSVGWVGNSEGLMFYFSGDSLEEYGLLDSMPITDIAGFSSGDIWASCGNSLFHYDGNVWLRDSVFIGEEFNALFILDSKMWAAGSALFFYNGGLWEICELPSSMGTELEINSIYFSSYNKGVMCGVKIDKGFVLEYDNIEWIQKTVTQDVLLNDINIFDNGEGWAVGDRGAILYSSGENNQ
jgi:photosystem II stability/assembly factor-like uncharacterized protein